MKIKKLMSLLLCALCLTACAEFPPIKEPVPAEEQKVIAPPEGGWTAEEIMSVAYMDGVQLEYPLTLRSLGSGVILSTFSDNDGEKMYLLEDASDSTYFVPGTFYADVKFDNDISRITADDPIAYIGLYADKCTVNGINTYSAPDDVVKALGEPDLVTSSGEIQKIYSYNDKESGETLMKAVFNGDKLLRIEIDL